MSVRVMTAVWELDLPDSDKLVLLALADCANDEGGCWPSMKTLAGKCSKSDRTIQASIKRLVENGHLTRLEKPGKGCYYYVHPVAASGMQGCHPKATHYTYRITCEETGEFYVGARSCYGSPGSDKYMGSGEWIKEAKDRGLSLSKAIIATFPSREALAVGEQELTKQLVGVPLCRNRRAASARTLSPFGGLPPEATSPRSDFAPQATTPTPEATSDKPSGTTKPKKDEPSLVARAKPKPAVRLPDDWEPEPLKPDHVTYGIVAAWQPGRLERELSKFRDYWAQASGRNARKPDWQAAWRTWIGKADEFGPRPTYGMAGNNRAGGSASGMGRTIDAAQRFVARGGSLRPGPG